MLLAVVRQNLAGIGVGNLELTFVGVHMHVDHRLAAGLGGAQCGDQDGDKRKKQGLPHGRYSSLGRADWGCARLKSCVL